jgi:integrase
MNFIGRNESKPDRHVATPSTAVVQRLTQWSSAARGAFAPNTERAYQGDSRTFAIWCSRAGLAMLPAEPSTAAAFLRAESEAGKAVATVRRRAATIARLHRAAGFPNPCDSEEVRLALRGIARERGTQQRQAGPLTAKDAHRIQCMIGENASLKDQRDLALLLVGKDLLARASELIALTVDAVSFDIDDGTAHVALRRRKTSTEPQDCLLGPDAAGALRHWLREAGITSGALFRSITKGGHVTGTALSARDLGRILKDLARRAKLDPAQVSSHSLRVGTAVDCVAANIDAASIMQAGGWTSVRMVARYTSKLAAKRGAIARLHKLGG